MKNAVFAVIFTLRSFGVCENTAGEAKRPNLLFIMTDQQRFDAIRKIQDELPHYDGKMKIETPNLDRLARSGAYFRKAYCQSPVCAPARGTLRTGCTIERNGVQANGLEKEETYRKMRVFKRKIESSTSLDQKLAENGYKVEYYGKWHIPDHFHFRHDGEGGMNDNSTEFSTTAVKYNDYNFKTESFRLVRNEDWKKKLVRYMKHDEALGKIKKKYKEGDQTDTYTGYPYTPIELDSRYGLPAKTNFKDVKNYPQLSGRSSQGDIKGIFSLGKDFTPIHYNGKIPRMALDRLTQESDGRPFALTVSFHNPHFPATPTGEFVDNYWEEKENIFVSPSIYDDMANSAYSNTRSIKMGYNNATKVQQWIALYYAMVEEIDYQIGLLLQDLEQYGLMNNTLIVFTSDHGEMLGAHALRAKNKFYEESVRVPLFMTLPGHIQPDTIVDESVSHIDVYATILDYLGITGDNSDGTSLRRFIENTSFNKEYDERVVVSEWDFRRPKGPGPKKLDRYLGAETNFMVLSGSHKFLTTKLSEASRMDMLYDLETDPYEMNNLIGDKSDSASDELIGKAEHLKCLLVEWMQRMNGPGYYSGDARWSDSMTGPFTDGIRSSAGDIEEVKRRRTWRSLDIWVGDTVLKFGRRARVGITFKRNEFLYFGRTSPGLLYVNDVTVVGTESAFFTIESPPPVTIAQGDHARLKISYNSRVWHEQVDAQIEISHGDGSLVRTRILFEENLTTPPSSSPSATETTSPSVSQKPSRTPSESPSVVPSASPSEGPSALPSKSPSEIPSERPSGVPSESPSVGPSGVPSKGPSGNPSRSAIPTNEPSYSPTTTSTQRPTSISGSDDRTRASTVGIPSVVTACLSIFFFYAL